MEINYNEIKLSQSNLDSLSDTIGNEGKVKSTPNRVVK